jgi:hypothetical protein
MSEQTTSVMQELDRWTDANMIAPLLQIAPDYREGHAVAWKKTVETVMKAIRTKMLESYQRNGRRPAPGRPGSGGSDDFKKTPGTGLHRLDWI